MTNIEWADETWNPVTGCSKVSQGCKNCYAIPMHARLRGMPNQPKYTEAFSVVRTHPESLTAPGKINGHGKRIFVNSMSDLFHPKVPFGFIDAVMTATEIYPQHEYLVLTKRAEIMRDYCEYSKRCYPNVWLGVSVEDRFNWQRAEVLANDIAASVKFLSVEPLLEDLGDRDFSQFDWVILGGESGPGARPMDENWARSIRDQCRDQNVPFFFKQWGGVRKYENGNVLDGVVHQALPIPRR